MEDVDRANEAMEADEGGIAEPELRRDDGSDSSSDEDEGANDDDDDEDDSDSDDDDDDGDEDVSDSSSEDEEEEDDDSNDETETMDDGGNGNGTIPNEREASLLLIQKTKKKLLKLKRNFKTKWCLNLFHHRIVRTMVAMRMLVIRNHPIENAIFEGGETMQAWSGSFQAMINVVGAEAMLVFLFKTMKHTHLLLNGRPTVVDENDTDEELERITIFEIVRECNGIDNAMRMLDAFEVLAPTFNINTALLLATSMHYEQGMIQVDGIYYLLKQQQRILHKYRTLFDAAVLGNTTNISTPNNDADDSFEARLATIFTFQTDDEDNKTTSDTIAAAATTTLFQKACTGLGRKTGLELLEETLGRSSQSINTRRALVYAATTNNEHRSANNNKEIHLDYIFLLLRREPDVLLSSSNRKSSSPASSLPSALSMMPPSLEVSSSINIINSANTDNDCRQHQSWKRQRTA